MHGFHEHFIGAGARSMIIDLRRHHQGWQMQLTPTESTLYYGRARCPNPRTARGFQRARSCAVCAMLHMMDILDFDGMFDMRVISAVLTSPGAAQPAAGSPD